MDVVVLLERASLQVEPGGEASTTARVRNSGPIVDEFLVEIVGEAAGWALIEPPSVSLFPGAEATVQVRFQPARTPAIRAGRIDFGIKASSRVDATRSTVEQGTVEVLPYRDEGLELVPRTSRGWRSAAHELRVTNGGNAPIATTISASDPDRLLTIDIQPATLSVEPAGSRVAQIRLTSKDAPLVGGSTRIPFEVSVDTGSQAALVTDGAFERRAPLPPWLAIAAAGLAGLIVIGIFLVFVIDPGGAKPSPSAGSPIPSEPAPESTEPESAPPASQPQTGCVLTITFPFVSLHELPDIGSGEFFAVPLGRYETSNTTVVEFAGQSQRWFEITVPEQREAGLAAQTGWVMDSIILIESKSADCL